MEQPDSVERMERTARDDYPRLVTLAGAGDIHRADAARALDEIDELRSEVAFLRNRAPVEL